MTIKRTSAMLAVLLVFPPAAIGQDFDKGMLAYKNHEYKEALEEFRPLARDDHPEAQYMLGLMYSTGRGLVLEDFSEGLRWYRQAAENGNPHALHWLRGTAERGDFDAQFDLGVMYIQGRGVPQDSVEALRWFRLAARDHANVSSLLRRIYDNGGDGSQDSAEALRLLRLAAEDDRRASYLLGRMYEKGLGIPQDYAEAVHWFRLAAKDRSYVSHWKSLYFRYRQLAQRGDADALRWFYSAAEQGDVEAQYNLANYLNVPNQDNNEGIDSAEAARLFRLAADQGHVGAQTELGFMYSEGLGIRQNHVKAARWFRLAAERGDDGAQSMLGELYAEGVGVRKNMVLAYKWGLLAEAYRDLEGYRYEMTPAQIKKAERLALKWGNRSEWRTRVLLALLTWRLAFS